jgi:ABC-type antimicrobial peptide transport system permease subunit
MGIDVHTSRVPAKAPDFFLATARDGSEAGLLRAGEEFTRGPVGADVRRDTRATTLNRDQSSLAALNITGLVDLDSVVELAMAAAAVGIFVFGLLVARRREDITLRAQGFSSRIVRGLITAEAATVAAVGCVAGVMVGLAMGYYFVAVLRPLFVLGPGYCLTASGIATPVLLVVIATLIASVAGSRLVNGLEPTELLRDE